MEPTLETATPDGRGCELSLGPLIDIHGMGHLLPQCRRLLLNRGDCDLGRQRLVGLCSATLGLDSPDSEYVLERRLRTSQLERGSPRLLCSKEQSLISDPMTANMLEVPIQASMADSRLSYVANACQLQPSSHNYDWCISPNRLQLRNARSLYSLCLVSVTAPSNRSLSRSSFEKHEKESRGFVQC